MGSAFHQLCPRYSGTLTPTAPTAIRLWDTFLHQPGMHEGTYRNVLLCKNGSKTLKCTCTLYPFFMSIPSLPDVTNFGTKYFILNKVHMDEGGIK